MLGMSADVKTYGGVGVRTGTDTYEWNYLHQGGRYDAASGLYHFRNREPVSDAGPVDAGGSYWLRRR